MHCGDLNGADNRDENKVDLIFTNEGADGDDDDDNDEKDDEEDGARDCSATSG